MLGEYDRVLNEELSNWLKVNDEDYLTSCI